MLRVKHLLARKGPEIWSIDSDEPVVLRAVRAILAAHPDVHVLLVPHAVTPASVRRKKEMPAPSRVPTPIDEFIGVPRVGGRLRR